MTTTFQVRVQTSMGEVILKTFSFENNNNLLIKTYGYLEGYTWCDCTPVIT